MFEIKFTLLDFDELGFFFDDFDLLDFFFDDLDLLGFFLLDAFRRFEDVFFLVFDLPLKIIVYLNEFIPYEFYLNLVFYLQ